MQQLAPQPKSSVAHLVATWVLIVPLLYFASQGQLWFVVGNSKTRLSSIYGALATPSQTAESAAIAITIFSIFGVVLYPRFAQVAKLAREDLLFSVLPIFAIASVTWSQYPIKTIQHALCLAINMLFAMYLNRRFSPARQIRLILLLGWICLISSIALSVLFPRYGIDRTLSTGNWQGIYGGKNQCGDLTALLMVGALYDPASARLGKISRVIYIALSVVVVIMTRSATSTILVLCLLCVKFVTSMLSRLRSRDRNTILCLAGPIAIALLGICAAYYQKLAGLLGKDPTLTGRTGLWISTLEAIRRHPFLGYGYMSFWNGYAGESTNASLVNRWAVTSSHNGFLEIWLTLGAVGVGLVIWSLIRAMIAAARCVNAGVSVYVGWCIAIIVLVVIYNMDEMVMMAPNHLAWILYVLACLNLSDEVKRMRPTIHDASEGKRI